LKSAGIVLRTSECPSSKRAPAKRDPLGSESHFVAHCNTEVFQAFLNTMAEEIPPKEGKRVHLALDNAGWRKSTSLNWHHIKPV